MTAPSLSRRRHFAVSHARPVCLPEIVGVMSVLVWDVIITRSEEDDVVSSDVPSDEGEIVTTWATRCCGVVSTPATHSCERNVAMRVFGLLAVDQWSVSFKF